MFRHPVDGSELACGCCWFTLAHNRKEKRTRALIIRAGEY